MESVPELEVINELAAAKGKIARVAFRINPDVGAHTHANITTGLAENKFGISMKDMDHVIDRALEMNNINFVGLHFHIGSQILDKGDFTALCNRINELQEKLYADLQAENQKNSLQLRDSINSFLKVYNQKKGYSLIISNTQLDNLLFADKSLDITQEIVDGLNARYTPSTKK